MLGGRLVRSGAGLAGAASRFAAGAVIVIGSVVVTEYTYVG